MEVCPLSRRMMSFFFFLKKKLNPYSFHYRTTFAFSTLLYPQLHQLTLRFAFPKGRATGLPCSTCITRRVRFVLFADGLLFTMGKGVVPIPNHIAILAQAFQHLWLVLFHDVYQTFTYVNRTIYPSPYPPDAGRTIIPSRFQQ